MKNLSFQLYSARNTTLDEALKIIAAAGYTSVEAYGANFEDAATFKSALQQFNLELVSAHIGLDRLRDDFNGCVAQAEAFSIKHLVCPFLQPGERPADTAGWIALAHELAGYAEKLGDSGITFAWHNHDFEFLTLPDGAIPMAILLDSAQALMWELDIGWIQRVGQDPTRWLDQYLSRVSAVHLKDVASSGSNADEDGWADVGHGNVDWQTLQPLLAKLENVLFIVEHDNPSDLARFATRSFTTADNWS